ncbi:MAG: serine/threonine-protein kinase [Deltaproteobacteria bacterium]
MLPDAPEGQAMEATSSFGPVVVRRISVILDDVASVRLADEVKRLRAVAHPNITPIVDFGVVDDQPVVAERKVGTRLVELAPPVADAGVCAVAVGIATVEALRAAQEVLRVRVVHPTLTAADVLLTEEGGVLVSDIALGRVRRGARVQSDAVGVGRIVARVVGRAAHPVAQVAREAQQGRLDLVQMEERLRALAAPTDVARRALAAWAKSPDEPTDLPPVPLFDFQLVLASQVDGVRRFQTIDARPPREDVTERAPVPLEEPDATPMFSESEADEATGWVGRTIRGHTLTKHLGSGAFAHVFIGRHEVLGRTRAIKILRREMAERTEFVDRMRREAQALALVNHPNVVGVVDYSELDGVPVIVLEYAEGATLTDLLDPDGLPPARVVDIGLQIARGMAAAHARGIVHRDLKPGNIVMTRETDEAEATVKLIDFGLARLTDAATLTASRRVMGTPAYMAPEQADSTRNAGAPADAYALGAILFEMLTGRVPFAASSVIEMLEMVRSAPVPEIDHFGGLGPLVTRLLAKSPTVRPTAEEVVRALESIDAVVEPVDTAVVVRAPPTRIVSRPATVAPNARARWWPLVAVLLVCGGLLGGAAWYKSREVPTREVVSVPRPVLPAAAPTVAAVPRAEVSAEASPPEEVESPAEPEAPEPTRRKRRRRVRAKPEVGAAVRVEAATQRVRAHAAAIGIETRDIGLVASAPWKAYRAARASGDASATEGAADTLIAALPEGWATSAVLEDKLARIKRALGKRAATLAPERLQQLERTYLSLRGRLERTAPAERRAFYREADRLEREIGAP